MQGEEEVSSFCLTQEASYLPDMSWGQCGYLLPKRKQRSLKVEKGINQFSKSQVLFEQITQKRNVKTEHHYFPDNEYLFFFFFNGHGGRGTDWLESSLKRNGVSWFCLPQYHRGVSLLEVWAFYRKWNYPLPIQGTNPFEFVLVFQSSECLYLLDSTYFLWYLYF